jgi:hypothetical protein
MFRSASRSLPQFLSHTPKLLKRRLKVLNDLSCNHIWRWQVAGVFLAVIFQPEDFQIGLVTCDQVFVGEGAERFAFLPPI